jgi:oxygen-independent coproporphyrinogen-3 oxidase
VSAARLAAPASAPAAEAARPSVNGAQGAEPRPPLGLYLHIPFCVSICPYCDFAAVAGTASRGPTSRTAKFVAALLVELDLRADALDARFGPPAAGRATPGHRPALRTAYLGGGTPSLLPADAIDEILGRVRKRFGLQPDAEVTLEANPGRLERGDPIAQRKAGVTRISFGAQTLVAEELPRIGRRHTTTEIADAVAAAREAGIGSVNLDLLYDIPGQSLASWTASLELALGLDPDHLSLYALILDDPDAEGLTGPAGDHLPVSKGARRWRERARRAQDEDGAAAMYHLGAHRLAEVGLRGYELSNWARPGHECRHNLLYWQRQPVEAVGPGAHAFDGAVRRWNAAPLEGYLTALRPPDPGIARFPPGSEELPLDPAAVETETLILNLRLDAGVPKTAILDPAVTQVFAWAAEAGLVEEDGGRIRLTTNGRLLSNEVFARLI